jgi:hypothetical protein
LNATGQFSFENDSNLQVDLTSSDAAELQTVFISSGLLPEVEEQMRSYGSNWRANSLSTETFAAAEFAECKRKGLARHVDREWK